MGRTMSRASSLLVVGALGLSGAGACGRTSLGKVQWPVDAAAEGVDADPDTRPDTAPDVMADGPAPVPEAAAAPDAPAVAACVPHDEVCNGTDDDCDGQIDEDQAPVPCPGGGNRYCVAGRMSECPRRCQVCVPGSRRVCFISYCTYWGRQICAEDGMSFGRCTEQQAPPECAAVVDSKKDSPDLERCCLDNGYCCLDEFDLDGNGNHTEMLGRCAGVTCEP